MPLHMALRNRILNRVTIEDRGFTSSCWISNRSAIGHYGHTGLRLDGVLRATHIWAYEEWVGPVPGGCVLDHLCRVPACCNPDHLEPVTSRTNTLRGDGPAARKARQTHCVRGHEFTEENTYRPPTRPSTRNCRACWALR